MSDLNLILKKLKILTNKEIWISDNVDVHSLYNNGNLKLIKGEVKNYQSSIDLTNEYLKHKREIYTGLPEKSYTNNWCTYKNCIEIQLYFDGILAKLQIELFEGNSWDGKPEELRWKGEFDVNSNCLHMFEVYIEYAFEKEIDRQFEIEEKIRIQKRKEVIKKKLLSE